MPRCAMALTHKFIILSKSVSYRRSPAGSRSGNFDDLVSYCGGKVPIKCLHLYLYKLNDILT